MAQHGKQMRVGDREGFANHSVKLILLLNSNRYKVYSKTLFLSGKALHQFNILPFPNYESMTFFYKHSYLESAISAIKLEKNHTVSTSL